MPRSLGPAEKALLIHYIEDRFAIPPLALAPFEILTFSRQAFLMRRPPRAFEWQSPYFVRAGLPFLRDAAGFLKPTTCFIQRFGHLARKNRIELDRTRLAQLCTNGEITLDEEEVSRRAKGEQVLSPTGYVIIDVAGHPLGCCLLVEGNRLLNRLPKSLRNAFKLPEEGQGALQ